MTFCRTLDALFVSSPRIFARFRAGRRMAMRMPMTAMTTSSSMRVKRGAS